MKALSFCWARLGKKKLVLKDGCLFHCSRSWIPICHRYRRLILHGVRPHYTQISKKFVHRPSKPKANISAGKSQRGKSPALQQFQDGAPTHEQPRMVMVEGAEAGKRPAEAEEKEAKRPKVEDVAAAELKTEEEEEKGSNRLKSLGYVPIMDRYLVPSSPAPKKEGVAPAPAPTEDKDRGTGKKESLGSGHQRSGKSRKQLKKERAARDKSSASICGSLARTGSCSFGDKCKFNHDIEAYLSQKDPDLPGLCLFWSKTGRCPYGVACRYYGTHKDSSSASPGDLVPGLQTMGSKDLICVRVPLPLPDKIAEEKNALRKELQFRLRKRQEYYPRSAEVLSEKGIKCRHFPKKKNAKAKNGEATLDNGDNEVARATERERKNLDFRNKLYLSPLTTVGNLPYRRICKTFGADITCGEMALATNLLQGQASEWALLKRHPSEDFFGVQIAGGYPDSIASAAELISRECDVDFIDINMGCPIDLLCNSGGGAALLQKPQKIKTLATSVHPVIDIPLTLKMRKGYHDGKDVVHKFIEEVHSWNVKALTLHGRTREQRYTRTADWDYIHRVADLAGDKLTVIGNGDIFNFEEYNDHVRSGNVSTVMIGRAALIKPWIFQEIKEQRHIDISATERFDMMKIYCANGLEHWGSDSRGVENTRRFLLEWMSFLHRYVPVGLLEVLPQTLGMRPPAYYGRSDLETLLASSDVKDWIKISEMLLGPTPANFFVPKHKSYSYKVLGRNEGGREAAENG